MSKQAFEQDLSQEEQPGMIFMAKLLFKAPVSVPEKSETERILGENVGKVDLFWHDQKGFGAAAKDYLCHFKDSDVPPQILATECIEFKGAEIDDFHRSQFWDCGDRADKFLSECKYQVVVTDMMAAALEPQERARLDMDFIEALLELYPDCEAIYFINSNKLYPADIIRQEKGKIPRESRFIKYAVNVRFFNIQGTDGDMVIDTVGMSMLFMPDLQYHFHGKDPNLVVYHAKCFASYMLDNNNPIKDGDPLDSINDDSSFNRDDMWTCRYEGSLIQPQREVIDIYMNEYAAGQRGEQK